MLSFILKLIRLLFFKDTKTTYNIWKTKIDFIFTDLFTIKNISENIGLNLKYRYKKHDRNIWKLNNQTYCVWDAIGSPIQNEWLLRNHCLQNEWLLHNSWLLVADWWMVG